MNENLPKMRLLKFDSKTCPVCVQFDKRGTLNDIAREYPTLEVVTLTCANADGESPEGSTYDAAYKLSDDLGVQAFPTLVLQDEHGIELHRFDGAPSISQIRKALDSSAEAINEAKALKLKVDAFIKMPK
jgi:thioredoxin-related protein